MKETLNRLSEYKYLTRKESKDILLKMVNGDYNEHEISAFITIFLMRSIKIEEFLGFRDALLSLCLNADKLLAYDPIDIVGTGGDNKNTFNISTLSSFVVAGAGYKVAKHGNFGATSISGASDVIQMQGATFSNDINKLEKSLNEANIAYLHAPLFNDAMKIVAPIRKSLGIRTFFNMLGPVVNPVKPKKCVLGVFNLKMARIYSYIYQETDTDYSIVHSLDGYDEVSLTSDFKLFTKEGEQICSNESIGLNSYKEEDLFGGNTKKEASRIFINVLNNRCTKAQKDVVIANAAIAIKTINNDMTLIESKEIAMESLESGKAKEMFIKFLNINS